jgi:hypothetical protein
MMGKKLVPKCWLALPDIQDYNLKICDPSGVVASKTLLERTDREREGVAEKQDELKLRLNSSRTFFIPRFSNAKEREKRGWRRESQSLPGEFGFSATPETVLA